MRVLVHHDPKNRIDHPDTPLLAALRSAIASDGRTLQQIASSAGVSPGTLGRWMAKEVHTPWLVKVEAVLRECGYELTIVPVTSIRH